MNVVHAGTAILLALWAFAACAADFGIYTVVDGDARVLRKTTWYRLEAGARAEQGDIVEAGARDQVQLELARGATLSIMGPALVYVADPPAQAAKAGASIEMTLLRGWVKAANKPDAPPLQLDLQAAALELADGIIVVHADPARTEFFVESGRVRLRTPAPRGKEVSRAAAEGEYWHRTGDRVFETDDRPSTVFVSAMPRALRDALPSLASRFDGPPPSLPAGREITFPEAQPWLSGTMRRTFARRFASRLADPAFRAEAAAAHSIPEWDRTLHPERYRPREAVEGAAPRAPVTTTNR
jgi:hypothetical protein